VPSVDRSQAVPAAAIAATGVMKKPKRRSSDQRRRNVGVFRRSAATSHQLRRGVRTEELLALIEQSPVEGVLIHRRGRILYVNEAYAAMLGYSRVALEKMTTDRLVAPHDLARLKSYQRKRTHGGGAPQRYEFQGKRKDGSLVWLEAFVRVIEWDGRRAIISTAVDISDRKRTETALKESEQRLRDLIEGSIEGIMVRNAKGAVLVNNTFARLFGYSAAELMKADTIKSLIMPHEQARLQGYLAARLEGRPAPTRYEFEGRRRDGGSVWIESSVRPVQWGGVEAVQVTCIDISERKRFEASLRRSEARYRDLVEGSIQAVAVLTSRMRPLFVNQAAARIFGFSSADELMAVESLDVYVAPEDRDRLRRYAIERFAGRPAPETYEFKGIKKDGSSVWVENRVRLVDWDGQRCLQGTLIDITERKRAAETAAQVQVFLQKIINTIPAVVTVKDDRRRYVMVNQFICDHWGLKPQDLLGQGVGKVIGDRSSQRRIRDDDDYVLTTGKTIPFKEIVLVNAGAKRTWLQTKVPIRHPDGNATHILTVSFDITERKRVENDLRASEARYRSLVEQAPDAILIHRDRKIVLANAAALKMLGAKSERDLIGTPILDRVHPDWRQTVRRRIESVIDKQRTAAPAEQSVVSLTNRRIDVDAVARFVPWEGRPAVQVVLRDVTERKRTERTLRFTQFAVDHSSDAAFWLDADGKIIYANAAASRMLGWRVDQLTRRSVWDINARITPALWPRALARIRRARRGLASAPGELRRRDGGSVPVEISANFLELSGQAFVFAFARDVTARVRAEEALRLTQFAVDRAADAVFWTRADGTFAYVNEAATRLLGYSRRELLSLTITDINRELSRRGWRRLFESIRSVKRLSATRILWRKDGSTVPVDVSSSHVRFHGGDYIFAFVRDVTERRRTEDALRLTQYAVDHASDAIFWVTPEGNFDYFNDAACRLLGYSRAQLVKMRVADIDPAMSAKNWYDHFERLKRVGVAVAEYNLLKRDGKSIPVEIADNYTEFAGKEYVFSFVRDISARKVAEAALREREEQLKSLTQNIPGSVFQRVMEPSGKARYTYISSGAKEVWGIDPKAVLDDATVWSDALHPEDRRRFDALMRLSAKKLIPIDTELRTFAADGRLKWIRFRSRPRRLSDGAIVWDGVSIDETDRKHAEQRIRDHEAQLAHALRVTTMGEMATALAHQLGQPLNAIANYARGSLRRIRAGRWTEAEVIEAMKQASDQAERAGRIVRDIAEFVRTSEPRRENVDVNAIVRSALSLAQGEASDAGVRIDLSLSRNLPRVAADPIQIEQVLLNLIRNGIEAMGDTWSSRRLLTIRTQRTDNREIRVDVRDSGPPADPDALEKMFEPFHSTKSGGMGMGLAISRTIVEAHDGKLWARVNRSRGLTLRFTLPIEALGE
jgi:PAS domain S-box-containing protein